MRNQDEEKAPGIEERRVLAVRGLSKTFKLGLRLKTVEAVRDASFEVERGEVFGFLGPNGAGKTTTIKICMGLIRATSGSVQLFGESVRSLEVRAKIGYLPEHPYFYDYLKPTEILDFYGKLFGLDRKERKRRIDRLLEQVGLSGARDRTLRKFSKGMLQRVGVAQALINDPEFLVFDEPLSGLDPIGRKEIRDIIVEQRARGKTILMSSHILSDIELICDKVAIINHGRIQAVGALDELLGDEQMVTEITVRAVTDDLPAGIREQCQRIHRLGDYSRLFLEGDSDSVLAELVTAGVRIESVVPKRESLEDLFVKEAIKGSARDARSEEAV